MAGISISDLNVTGTELLIDSESYLKELIDLEQVWGGNAVITMIENDGGCSTYVCSDCFSHHPQTFTKIV